MTKLSEMYREDAQFVQRAFDDERPLRVSKEYMRKLRYQIVTDRRSSSINSDTTRSSVTGY